VADFRLTYLDPANGTTLRDVRIRNQALCLAFTPDRKHVVWGSTMIHVQNADTNKEVAQFPSRAMLSMDYHAVAISSDSKLVASGNINEGVQVRELPSGNLVEAVPPPKGPVHGVAFAGGDRQLVICDGGGVRLWDRAKKKDVYRVPGTSFALPADGKTLAVGTEDGSIVIYERATGKELRKLAGHRGRVTALAFAPDGKTLASGAVDTTILLWNVR
jgi:WD40 repeat protein